MFKIEKEIFNYGNHQVSIETGEIARQSTAAVLVSMGDTSVLCTVVGKKEAKEGQDFFPLTVDYIEKTYAAGKIPGGFFKREGRPSEKETLTSRLIDRPIRPLFPDGFYNEVQIVCTVMSLDPDIDPDIVAMIGVSSAISLSGMPFKGPVGAARVGFINEQYVLNPSSTELEQSKLNLVVAGTENAVLMVESEANELSEEEMLGAVVFGHEQMRTAIDAICRLVEKAGKPAWDWKAPEVDEKLLAKISNLAESRLNEAYKNRDKQERSSKIKEVYSDVSSEILSEFDANSNEGAEINQNLISDILFNLESKIVRSKILNGEPRIDGRDTRTVRPIEIRTGVLPRAHGSALFTRGETQALVVATLGTNRDEQIIDALEGEYRDPFMLHYNMPPYATGECGRVGTPKRREIGHGRLAKRSLLSVLPSPEDFAYSIRIVSEITESNGSSSMASVCGGCLAMMDAGVPLKTHIAGIAMGLIKEENKFSVLTDILGDEDHLGDMDFKVAGSENGITALQMDIKIEGINEQIMDAALEKAKAARMHILDVMNAVIDKPKEVSDNAPAMKKFTVHQDKIKEIIGKGGAVIKNIQQESGASVDINDDGVVTVFGENQSVMQAALSMIETIIEDPEVNKIYDGKVVKIVDFGAFVNILPGKDGLLHISEISEERTENVSDVLSEGDTIKVKLIGFDRGKLKLSAKAVDKE